MNQNYNGVTIIVVVPTLNPDTILTTLGILETGDVPSNAFDEKETPNAIIKRPINMNTDLFRQSITAFFILSLLFSYSA